MIVHKGWDWESVPDSFWEQPSADFLPVALDWAKRFQTAADIGAGKGRHTFLLAGLGMQVTACDLSESSIRFIRARNAAAGGSVTAQQADMTALPFAAECFDCAVCFHTVFHTDYAGMKLALSELRRILKPEGELFVTFNSKESPSASEGTRVDGYTVIKTEGSEKGIPHSYIGFSDIPELMPGFSLINVRQIRDYICGGQPTGGIHYYVHARKTGSAATEG